MTRFPRNVCPRPRVCLLPRGHLRRLSPEKRFATMPAKRGPRLCYIYICSLGQQLALSEFLSFPICSPFFPFFRDVIPGVKVFLHIPKYTHDQWELWDRFLTVKRFLSFSFVDRKCEGKWANLRFDYLHIMLKLKINFSNENKKFLIKWL